MKAFGFFFVYLLFVLLMKKGFADAYFDPDTVGETRILFTGMSRNLLFTVQEFIIHSPGIYKHLSALGFAL